MILNKGKHIIRLSFILFSCFFSFKSFAIKEDPGNSWLKVFVEAGLTHVEANYSLKDTLDPNQKSNNYLRSADYQIELNTYTREYTFKYAFVYRENWDVLTMESGQPPKLDPKFVGSKIEPWTVYQGIAEYSETHERTYPNWMNFNQLDTLLNLMVEYNCPMPAVNDLFTEDEFSQLKKLKKKKAPLSRQFTYDKKGNVVGFSRNYLQTNLSIVQGETKEIAEFDITLTNRKGDSLTIVPVRSDKNEIALDGLFLQGEEGEVMVFNFTLNKLFHKFSPDIFRDPEMVLEQFKATLH